MADFAWAGLAWTWPAAKTGDRMPALIMSATRIFTF
jgi:hypothetical protein